MDCDENDFQSQNFHLVGEDKFSTNLRSFALPRFDLDEELRFDGLVEEEVLLGIQGQENNWIDFPSGNTAIEFSSSAVESCSIARTKNVWSEATSSESVDLLLKSMGEDEIINNKAVIIEACANDEDDDKKSYLLNMPPVDPKNSSNQGPREILPNVHGLSHTAEGEDSRVTMLIDRSNGKVSSDGELGDNIIAFYNPIEKSKADDNGLSEAFVSKKDPEGTLVSSSDLSVVDCPNLQSNPNESSSNFLCEGAQNEKCLVMYNDDKGSHQLMSKTDAFGLLTRKSIYSEFSRNSTGLAEAIPFQTNYLNGNNEMHDKLYVKKAFIDQLEMVQDDKLVKNSVTNKCRAILEIAQVPEIYRNIGENVPFDCIIAIDDKQAHVGQLVEDKSIDDENATQMVTKSPISIHVNYEDHGMNVEDRERINTVLPSLPCEKSGLVVEGNPDNENNDEDKETPGESSLPIAIVTDSESTPISTVKLTEVLMPDVLVSADKVSALTCMDHDKIISDPVSHIMEKVQDFPLQDVVEGLPLDFSTNKVVQEELDTGQHDVKDAMISCLTVSSHSSARLVSEKESALASLSYPSNIKGMSPENVLQGDSVAAPLAFPVKSPESQLSQYSAVGNVVVEPKGPSCSVLPDTFSSEGNEVISSGTSILSNSKIKDENAIVTEHLSNTAMQPPSSMRTVDFARPQNDISSSARITAGNNKSPLLEGNNIFHDPLEGKSDNLNSLEVVSSARYDTPVGLDNLNSHMKFTSQMCTGITAESNSSEAQSDSLGFNERNCDLPMVINCGGCHPDNLDHQEPLSSPVSVSDKDEVTLKIDGSSSGLDATSVEDRIFSFGVSTFKDLPEKLKSNDIPQTPKVNSHELPNEVKLSDSLTQTPIPGKSKNSSRSEKKTSSKGKIKKDARSLKQSCVMDVKCSSSVHKYVGNLSMDKPLIEMREKSSNDCSAKKSSTSLDAQTTCIPDLNSSSSLALSHHNFTDLQQVQLRAQIFVYGALISGMPPDEAYMVSAFGGPDGGRNLWLGLWHASIERFQNQKSPLGGYDTPSQSRPGWIPEHVSMGNDVQSKVPTACTAKSNNIFLSSSGLSSTASLPSPLWSLSYGNDGHHASISRGSYMNFSQGQSPLPRQGFVSRQTVGANSSWLSQSSRPVPWFISSQVSALDGIPQYSTVPVTDTSLTTPVRDSCGPHASTVEIAPHRILMHGSGTAAPTTDATLPMETPKGSATSLNKFTPTSQKVRKRKKSLVAEDLTVSDSQTLAESVSSPNAFKNLPLPSSSMILPSNSQLNIPNLATVSISMPHIISPSHYPIIGINNNQQRSILYEETCSKLEQTKLQAEEAASFAASTVKYSQELWSQLATHKNSGIGSEIEEKLASAAAAVAASASVAKAAAAAANVASVAALQAKTMADEAMSAIKTANTGFNPESDILDVGKRLAGVSPALILKGMDKIHSSGAVISAASEATRRRVESASAATKRAKNLDAIVKAAELAAEAVTQAGTIISMGDPLPFTLTELVDAGPEGFWRGHDGTSMKLSHSSYMHGGLGNAKVPDGSANQLGNQLSINKNKLADEGELSSLNGCYEQFQGNAQGKFSSYGPEADHDIVSSIQKGSVVEVMSDEDGFKGAWFSARVLDLGDNKAYVCYNDVSNIEGKRKEWILLDNGGKPPRIRTAHSSPIVNYEGTKKRRRTHLGSYIWEVGDHVDTWIHDRWWEGTIMEKCPEDETKLTVHIPARGDKQVVYVWNLRPSLIWKDGQWMEWPHVKGNPLKLHEGDTPQEKRQRLGRLEENIPLEVDGICMAKLSKSVLMEEIKKPDDSKSLILSAKERIFSIGKNSSEQVTSDTLKQKRTGLQKEGSRVVFGVPRPGKKRKFMEVSKHYVANKPEKLSEGNSSIKFAKYLMPQASRQSRNTSKVDIKVNKAVQIKPKGDLKTVNSQSFQTRRVTDKDKAPLSTSNVETVQVYHNNSLSSFKGNNNGLDKLNASKFGVLPNQPENKNISVAELEQSVQSAPSTLSKKTTTSGSETDLVVKQTSSTDRTPAAEDKGPGKPVHEVTEPRRSNRRIQPTSRLLEGLQSSLVISKVPSISHERKPPRGGTSSRGNVHG